MEQIYILVLNILYRLVEFVDFLNSLTFLNVWFLPVVLSSFFLVAFLVVLYFTAEARSIRYRFITIGSHKLRTPLSKIKGAVAELLQKKEAANFRKESYELSDYDERMLHQIAIENNRLVGLVNLLLEVSESEKGRPKYHFEKSDMVSIVREILTSYQNSQWRNNLVFIEFQANEEYLFACIDKKRIYSVIQVLLENAITYSPAGGQVIVSIRRDKKKVIVSVQDHGIGILGNEKKYIFSKFFRSDRALHIDTEGTGIGLFLAKHIVEGHGGKLWFESQGEHEGSTFYFTLPYIDVTRKAASAN